MQFYDNDNKRSLKDVIEEVENKVFYDMCNGTFSDWDSYIDYRYELEDNLIKAYGEYYAGYNSDKLTLGISINEVFTEFYSNACKYVVYQNQDYYIRKYINVPFTLFENDDE